MSSPSARFGIDRILSGACAVSTGSTSARNIKKWPLLLPVLPCNLILCTCTGSWAKRTAPSVAAAAQQLQARRWLRHVATITMKMGKPYPPSYPPPLPSLPSPPHPPPRHGSHVAGQPDSTCFRTNTRTYSHVVCTSGTIAGSTNLAVDTNPSSFRNNGVAGASVLSSTARGAQLFFQVFQQRDGIRAVHDASPGHSKQSDRCRLRLSGTWQKMCTARKCFWVVIRWWHHVGFAGGDGLSLPTDINDLLNPPYDAGARVHSNSWGCVPARSFMTQLLFHRSLFCSCVADGTGQSCNLYDSQARAFDQ